MRQLKENLGRTAGSKYSALQEKVANLVRIL